MNQTIFLTPEKREAQKLAQLRTRERKQAYIEELMEKNAAKNRKEPHQHENYKQMQREK